MFLFIINHPKGRDKEGFNIFCGLEKTVCDFVQIEVLVNTSDDPF